MTGTRTSEPAFNTLLARALSRRHPRWDVAAEQTGAVSGAPGLTPDIVIEHRQPIGWSPVVIETEWEPARTVEDDAESRLGRKLSSSGRVVEQVVALAAPDHLHAMRPAEMSAAIDTAECRYRLASLRKEKTVWFPSSGWLTGTVSDLAGLCEQASTNELVVRQAAEDMERTVASVSRELAKSVAGTGALGAIATMLHQEESEQTTRIGVAMIANALVFQLAIEGHTDPADGWQVPGLDPGASRQKVLDTWSRILNINYWPIFFTAAGVLEQIPQQTAQAAVLPALTRLAQSLAAQGAASTSDMAGQILGKLISDRKFLATFYTRRESARLLAELAVERLPIDWSDHQQVSGLRIADLACGTGALLGAVYDRAAARVRRAGSDDADLHPEMMEKALIGADIMPAAAHLTCTALSALHPSIPYARSGIHRVPYGQQPDKEGSGSHIRIGSLELLQHSYQQENWLDTGDVTVMPVEAEPDDETSPVVKHDDADLVIMNPPFTRSTKHDAEAAGVPVPSFAGFGTPEEEQRLMAARLVKLSPTGAVGHGNAGLASNFIDLAHAKLKRGGVLALVVPLPIVSGGSWDKARKLLAGYYKDICVISLASPRSKDSSFSADTDMAEALIVATRRALGEPAGDVCWVTLAQRPADPIEATALAQEIATLRRSDAPASGQITIGEAHVGRFAYATMDKGAGHVGVLDDGPARCGEAMLSGGLWLPRLHDMPGVVLASLKELGDRGPYHLDIRARPPRGPFDVEKTTAWRAAEYPMLWAHNAGRETRLVVEPDRQGRVRDGMDAKAQKIWDTRSRLHFTLDFRLNSQPLAACFTPVQCIGGTAWPSFTLQKPEWEPAVLSWANTTLGLIAFWWLGSRQQRGRARLSITSLPDLPVLDPRSLTTTQLDQAQAIFDQFKDEEFLPANEAYRDSARAALDEAVLFEVLGLAPTSQDRDDITGALEVLRQQWCREPTVHGGKKTRP